MNSREPKSLVVSGNGWVTTRSGRIVTIEHRKSTIWRPLLAMGMTHIGVTVLLVLMATQWGSRSITIVNKKVSPASAILAAVVFGCFIAIICVSYFVALSSDDETHSPFMIADEEKMRIPPLSLSVEANDFVRFDVESVEVPLSHGGTFQDRVTLVLRSGQQIEICRITSLDSSLARQLRTFVAPSKSEVLSA